MDAITDEILVNTFTDFNQQNVQLAGFQDGSFVSVWQSATTSGQDIIAQIFDENHQKSGLPIVITQAEGIHSLPSVSTFSDKSFVVTWQSRLPSSNEDIYAALYDPNSEILVDIFRVNRDGDTLALQVQPRISSNDDFFAVTWKSGNNIHFDYYNKRGACLTCFSALVPVNSNNQTTSSFNNNPAIDISPINGDTAIVWESDVSSVPNTGLNIFLRLYNKDGNSLLQERIVNSDLANDQKNPVIKYLNDGTFFVVWESLGILSGSGSGILMRHFDSSGNALSNDQLISSFGTPGSPSIDRTLSLNNFIVSWHRTEFSNHQNDIVAQIFRPDGRVLDDEVLISNAPINDQSLSSVSFLFGNRFVVGWQSAGQIPNSGIDIYSRMFESAFTRTVTPVVIPAPTDEPEEKEDTKFSGGAIAGIVVGVSAVIGAVIGVVTTVLCCCKYYAVGVFKNTVTTQDVAQPQIDNNPPSGGEVEDAAAADDDDDNDNHRHLSSRTLPSQQQMRRRPPSLYLCDDYSLQQTRILNTVTDDDVLNVATDDDDDHEHNQSAHAVVVIPNADELPVLGETEDEQVSQPAEEQVPQPAIALPGSNVANSSTTEQRGRPASRSSSLFRSRATSRSYTPQRDANSTNWMESLRKPSSSKPSNVRKSNLKRSNR